MGMLGYIAECGDLFWDSRHSGGLPQGLASRLSFSEGLAGMTREDPQVYQLSYFNAIHMRKEPPVDILYQAATWMFDAVGQTTLTFNAPSGLRALNEKVSTLLFPEEAKFEWFQPIPRF